MLRRWGALSTGPSGPAVDRGPRHVAAVGAPALRVTSGVVAQVNRAGASQMQVALRGFRGGTKVERRKVRFRVEDRSYVLVVGDSHAAWRSHQTEETRNSFEELFAIAADTPGAWLPVTLCEGEMNP